MMTPPVPRSRSSLEPSVASQLRAVPASIPQEPSETKAKIAKIAEAEALRQVALPNIGDEIARHSLGFDAEQNSLVFSADWLKHRLPGDDPALRRLLHKQIDALEVAHGDDLPAKGAILNLTRALACELAQHDITVNCISPGQIPKPTLNAFTRENFRNMVPLARLGEPQDMANAALYLCSPTAAWVSGQILTVSGGGVQELD